MKKIIDFSLLIAVTVMLGLCVVGTTMIYTEEGPIVALLSNGDNQEDTYSVLLVDSSLNDSELVDTTNVNNVYIVSQARDVNKYVDMFSDTSIKVSFIGARKSAVSRYVEYTYR